MEQHLANLKKRLDQLEQKKSQDIINLNQYFEHHLQGAHDKKISVLDSSLSFSKMDNLSLRAMIAAMENFIPKTHNFLLCRNRFLKRERILEWDLLPPPPKHLLHADSPISQEQLIQIVSTAFDAISIEWGEMIREIYNRRLINFSSEYNFARQGKDSDYLNINIDFKNDWRGILTLSHEMGHAFHCRNTPVHESFSFGMSEFCSTFAEYFIRQKIQADDPKKTFEILWSQISVPDLIMGPLCFELEEKLFEKTSSGPISIEDAEEIESACIKKWFKINALDRRPTFWQRSFRSKDVSFYNYPYTIGFLLSAKTLTTYSQSPKAFFPIFKNMLTDSARCSIKEFVKKYWNQDSTQIEFWSSCLDPVLVSVKQFQTLS